MKNTTRVILAIDAVINFILGILLLVFSDSIVQFLGVPTTQTRFYPNLLGAVLIGIGIALTIECFRKSDVLVGLGLGGAIAINMSGGLVLAMWLIFGDIDLPDNGVIFLWSLAALLLAVSLVELIVHFNSIRKGSG